MISRLEIFFTFACLVLLVAFGALTSRELDQTNACRAKINDLEIINAGQKLALEKVEAQK